MILSDGILSLGTGETKEGGKRFEDFVGHEGWMSFTKAFSRWAGECFSKSIANLSDMIYG